MKKIFLLLFIPLAGSLIFPSCKKALTEKSYDFLVPSGFYKTEADANAAIIGVYNTLLSYGFYKQNLWNFDNDCDHASGPGWWFGSVGQGNFQGYWGTDNIWNDHYLMISRANSVIENVAGMSIDPSIKQRVLGEAYFFRAFSYFDLVRLYGGVPVHLHTVASNAETPYMPRATVVETYNQIIADFKQAETMLFPYEDKNSGGNGHVTKDVASAYLAKTYATIASGSMPAVTINVLTARFKTGDDKPYGSYPFTKKVVAGLEGVNTTAYYDSARMKSAEVIANSGRTLFPNFMDNFNHSNWDKNENMLMADAQGPNYSTDDLALYFSGNQPVGVNYGGWEWGSKNFYNNYLTNGTRLDERALYGINHRPVIDGKHFFPLEDSALYKAPDYTWDINEDKAYSTKYDDITQPIKQGNDAHYPILRLADVYLINAEANNELGNMAEAYVSLNKIRQRAKTLDAPAGMSKDAFRSFVIEERGREFFFENNRRYDLARWGIYLDLMNFMNSDAFGIVKVRDPKALLLPIPQSEINSNKALNNQNNPGY